MVFTFISGTCRLPTSSTPAVLVNAIDAFLARLLVAGGVPIPAFLIAQWREERRARASHHRYSRMRRAMPWMFDEGKKASEEKQMAMVRRDFRQEARHQFSMGLQARAEWYLTWMYERGMVKFAVELSGEERMRAMRYWASLVSEYSTQLQMEEWLGSEVWIGASDEGYAWEWGVLKVPWDMTQKEVWKLTQRYVTALRRAREDIERREEEEKEAKEDEKLRQMTEEETGSETEEKRMVTELTDEEVERLLGSYDMNAGATAHMGGDHPPELPRQQAIAGAE